MTHPFPIMSSELHLYPIIDTYKSEDVRPYNNANDQPNTHPSFWRHSEPLNKNVYVSSTVRKKKNKNSEGFWLSFMMFELFYALVPSIEVYFLLVLLKFSSWWS